MRLVNRPRIKEMPFIQWIPAKQECHKFEIDGKSLIYDCNSMALWDTPKEIFSALDEHTLGVSEKPFMQPDMNQAQCKMLVFQTTYACNLKCRYCFVRLHYVTEENRLSLSDANRALDLYQSPVFNPQTKRYEGNMDISFFGGEPLLNWELIYQVSELQKKRCDKYGIPPHLHITSNGTRVTEEIAEYCAQNNFSWIISLDGTENTHDNNRPYHSGTGSWKDAMRGLEFISNAYQKLNKPSPVTLRATFDKAGVNLVETLTVLNKLMYDGMAGHVSVEPSSLGEGCSTDQSRFETLNADEIRGAFEPQYKEAAKWFLAELNAGRKPSFHHFEMPLQRLYDRQPSFTECGAGKGYLSIGPGGKISACHRENCSEIGCLKNGIDQTEQAKWMNNLVFVRDGCNKCWHRLLCGGGCRHDSLQAGLPISKPVPIECLFKEMQVVPVMWLLSQMNADQKEMYTSNRNGQQQRPQQTKPQAQNSACAAPQQRPECNDPNCKCHKKQPQTMQVVQSQPEPQEQPKQ